MLQNGASQRLAGTILLILASSLFLSSATAQDPVGVTVRSDKTSIALGPNESAPLALTITNTGRTDGTVVLTVPQPAGWIVRVADADRRFSLAAGMNRVVPVSIQPATDSQNETMIVVARLENVADNDEDRAEIALSYVAPLPPPPPPPPSRWPITLAATGATVGVLAALYVASSFLVKITVATTHLIVVKGTPSHYDVQVHNRSPFRQTVQLRVRHLRRPWFAASNVPYVTLEPRESMIVPVSVRPPFEADDGSEVRFTIQARPHRWALWLVRRPLAAQVAVKERIVPEASPVMAA